MDLSASVLGTGIVETLSQRIAAPVLVIGRDRFTRGDLAGVACFNYQSCVTLTGALVALKVRDTADVFERISPELLALPRVGGITLAVLGAAFEAKGVGGPTPLHTWMQKHLQQVRTFTTIKHREAKEAAAEQKETKARKARRRDKAHAIRVDRFESRTAAKGG